jgi:hypothetical protein
MARCSRDMANFMSKKRHFFPIFKLLFIYYPNNVVSILSEICDWNSIIKLVSLVCSQMVAFLFEKSFNIDHIRTNNCRLILKIFIMSSKLVSLRIVSIQWKVVFNYRFFLLLIVLEGVTLSLTCLFVIFGSSVTSCCIFDALKTPLKTKFFNPKALKFHNSV